MRIGAHISTAGGIHRSIERAVAIGAECMQVFGCSPQSWAFRPHLASNVSLFRDLTAKEGIGPNVMHGIYLINLGAQDPAHIDRGVRSLASCMALAAESGIAGVIFHVGSHKGAGLDAVLPQVVAAIVRVLEASPAGPWLALENCAGSAGQIGGKLEDLGRVIAGVGSSRLRVCLDTEHAFAAGYNLADHSGMDTFMEEFDRFIGFDRLVAVHANDAKVPFGSGVDRHANIGEGFIGSAGFEVIMSHSALAEVPFYLEVPGPDGKGPDAANVQRLKEIRSRLGVPA